MKRKAVRKISQLSLFKRLVQLLFGSGVVIMAASLLSCADRGRLMGTQPEMPRQTNVVDIILLDGEMPVHPIEIKEDEVHEEDMRLPGIAPHTSNTTDK